MACMWTTAAARSGPARESETETGLTRDANPGPAREKQPPPGRAQVAPKRPPPIHEVIDLTGEDEAPGPVGQPAVPTSRYAAYRQRRRLNFQIKYNHRCRMRTKVDKRVNAQAEKFNRSGRARTRDDLMVTVPPPDPADKKRRKGQAFQKGSTGALDIPQCVKGQGQWKKWTGPAICQAAYAPAARTSRGRALAEGASHAHVQGTEMFTADMVLKAQNEHGKRLCKESGEMYITNNMFDETKLYVAAPGGYRAKRRCTLAQRCQSTFQRTPAAEPEDNDIIRPPALMGRCTAKNCAGVVGDPKDPFGILPERATVPKAAFYGIATATDSHSVNKLVSKFVAAEVDRRNTYKYKGPHGADDSMDPFLASFLAGIVPALGGDGTANDPPIVPDPMQASGSAALGGDAIAPPIVPDPMQASASAALGGDATANAPPLAAEGPSHKAPFWAHVASYCIQHKTGNVVENVTKFLGLLGPSFCLASVLADGDDVIEQSMDLLEKKLEVVDPATIHFSPADKKHLQFQKELLELCLVRDTGPGADGKPCPGVQKRREQAAEFLKFFGAPWTDEWGVKHLCPAGCCGKVQDGPCANKAESIKRARAHFAVIANPPVTSPAANKYTKVDPTIRSVSLLNWALFGLLRKAMGAKLKKKGGHRCCTDFRPGRCCSPSGQVWV